MPDTKLQPFEVGTRPRFQKVGSFAANSAQLGSTIQVVLPRVGYVSTIVVQFRGVITLSSAGALADLGPWSLVDRFRFTSNIGSATIVDISGYGLYMVQPQLATIGAYRADAAGAGTTTPSADLYAAPVASGANTWVLTWLVPVGLNQGKNRTLGIIDAQAPEVQLTLEIAVTGSGANFVTNFTSITGGTFEVGYYYYEVPDPRMFAQPPLCLVRTLEDQQPIVGTGENIYTLPRLGVLIDLIHRVTLNAARSDSVDRLEMRFNKTDRVFQLDRQFSRLLERLQYAVNPITGVMKHPALMNADGDVQSGPAYDAIDTEELTTLESVVVVSSGASLGSNNNFLTSPRRVVQMLEG